MLVLRLEVSRHIANGLTWPAVSSSVGAAGADGGRRAVGIRRRRGCSRASAPSRTQDEAANDLWQLGQVGVSRVPPPRLAPTTQDVKPTAHPQSEMGDDFLRAKETSGVVDKPYTPPAVPPGGLGIPCPSQMMADAPGGAHSGLGDDWLTGSESGINEAMEWQKKRQNAMLARPLASAEGGSSFSVKGLTSPPPQSSGGPHQYHGGGAAEAASMSGLGLGVGGLSDVVDEVRRRILIPLTATSMDPELLDDLGVNPVRGLLLYARD